MIYEIKPQSFLAAHTCEEGPIGDRHHVVGSKSQGYSSETDSQVHRQYAVFCGLWRGQGECYGRLISSLEHHVSSKERLEEEPQQKYWTWWNSRSKGREWQSGRSMLFIPSPCMLALTFFKVSLPAQVKSILKPTIKFSPPKAIPPRSGAGATSPTKMGGQRPGERYPKLSPNKKIPERSPSRAGQSSPSKLIPSPRSPARVAVRTEEEQHAAAREKQREEAHAQKDARRKSLGTP